MSHVIAAAAGGSVPVAGSRGETFPVHRIYCVGRNYVEHAKEMGFTGREPPFFFMKPADAVLPVAEGEVGRMPYPSLTKDLHHEVELVVAIGNGRQGESPPPTRCGHVWGYAVGLDMTRRDLQGEAKKLGRPVGHRQELRPLGADRPDPPRCRMPGRRRHADHARGQRHGAPAEHDRQADLEHRRDHRAPVGGVGAAAGRPDLHRHAGRRRRGRARRRAEGRGRRASARCRCTLV